MILFSDVSGELRKTYFPISYTLECRVGYALIGRSTGVAIMIGVIFMNVYVLYIQYIHWWF